MTILWTMTIILWLALSTSISFMAFLPSPMLLLKLVKFSIKLLIDKTIYDERLSYLQFLILYHLKSTCLNGHKSSSLKITQTEMTFSKKCSTHF